MRWRDAWARTQFYRWPRRVLEAWRIWTGRHVQPGVYIAEQIAVGPYSPVSEYDIAATFEKGPVNEPVRITSWAQFVEVFGAEVDGAADGVARDVYAFLRDTGQPLTVTRVVDSPSGSDGETIGAIEKLVDLIGQINARKEDLARAAAMGSCPRCGAPLRGARWGMFIEAGVGLTERLIATCAAGCEFAVDDADFAWISSDDVIFPARVRMAARVLAGVVRRECTPPEEDA